MATRKSKPAAPPATRRRADSPEQKTARRQAILRAAAAELARPGGADSFTIEALARKLGLAKGTVYLYFPSKNTLFISLLGDTMEDLLIPRK